MQVHYRLPYSGKEFGGDGVRGRVRAVLRDARNVGKNGMSSPGSAWTLDKDQRSPFRNYITYEELHSPRPTAPRLK